MSFKTFSTGSLRQFSKGLSTISTRKLSTVNMTERPQLARWIPVVAGASLALGYYFYSTSDKIRADSKKTLLGDNEWVELKLAKVEDLSHNVKHFTFALPSSDHVLGLETASALLAKFTRENGKNVLRPYTPVSDPEKKGEFDLVIKRYEGGLLSNHLFSLKPNDTVEFKGPLLKYKWSPNLHKEIALIGGGTGITPLYQLIHAIDKNPADKTKVTLILGNVTEEDILLKKELDSIAKTKPSQFKVYYFLDKPSESWKGNSGYITKEFLKSNIFSPTAENVKVFVCGPPPLYNAISGNKVSPTDQGELTGSLKELGFTKEQVFKF